MRQVGHRKRAHYLDGVTHDALSSAVAASRSWRGVLRCLGLPDNSSRLGRLLRMRCDELEVDYSHFRGNRSWTDADLIREVPQAQSWSQLLVALGCSEASGSARTRVRASCARLGVPLDHLSRPVPDTGTAVGLLIADSSNRHLREAGPLLLAALLTLKGRRVSWPLEPAAYDLVADLGDGCLSRVQVKTTTHRNGGAWLCSLTRAHYDSGSRWARPSVYDVDEIDYFGIVDGALDCYLIPVEVVAGLATISLQKYVRFRVGRMGQWAGTAGTGT